MKTTHRLFVRIADSTEFMQILSVVGIATVLCVRGFLYITGYPQIGGHGLHIAHVLWGGLFMLLALVVSILFVGKGARTLVPVLGGIGLGLFIDEIGKFLTSTNNYFYRPAAAIIYIVFAALVLASTLLSRDKLTDRSERLANAAFISMTALASGITSTQRAEALATIEGIDGDEASSLRALINSISDRKPSVYYTKLMQPIVKFYDSAIRKRWLTNTGILIFVIYTTISLGIYLDKSIHAMIDDRFSNLSIFAISASDVVSLVLLAVGAIRITSDRQKALGWFRVAILLNLFFGQIFNFSDSQFSAFAGVTNALVAYALVAYEIKHPIAKP